MNDTPDALATCNMLISQIYRALDDWWKSRTFSYSLNGVRDIVERRMRRMEGVARRICRVKKLWYGSLGRQIRVAGKRCRGHGQSEAQRKCLEWCHAVCWKAVVLVSVFKRTSWVRVVSEAKRQDMGALKLSRRHFLEVQHPEGVNYKSTGVQRGHVR